MQITGSPRHRYDLQKREAQKKSVQSPSESEIALYTGEVTRLARIFGDQVTWMLEGGHVLPFLQGAKYNRQHADIDIGIFSDELEKFYEYIISQGYGLFFRNYHLKFLESVPFDMWIPATLERIKNWRIKRLYMLPISGEGRIKVNKQMEVDVHIHHRLDDGVLNGNGFKLPIDWFCSRAVSVLGQEVPVGDLRLCYFHKLAGGRPRHIFDCEQIMRSGLIEPEEFDSIKKMRQTLSR